jgi:hypothetical protein
VVPTSGGGTKPPANLSGASSAKLDELGAGGRTARKLARLGAAGSAAADWARDTAPSVVGRTPGVTKPESAGGGPGGGSAASGLLDLLDGSDSGGIGLLLPLLLALTLAGAVGFAVGRRRPRRA